MTNLDSSVWAEIEIILTWMTNVCVNNGTSWDIVALSNHILSIFTEKSHVMALKIHLYRQQLWSGQVLVRGSLVVISYLLDTDESDSWLIGAIFFQFKASITHGLHLMGQNKLELTFANTITVHHNLKIAIKTILHCWIDLLVVVFCRSCDRIDAKASSPCPWCQQWIPIVVLVQRLLPEIIYYQAADCIEQLVAMESSVTWNLHGTGSIEPTMAAIEGRDISPAAGWVTSAPNTITGSFMIGERSFDGIEIFWPPHFVLIWNGVITRGSSRGQRLFTFKSKLSMVELLLIALPIVWLHNTLVITPTSVSPARFTSE